MDQFCHPVHDDRAFVRTLDYEWQYIDRDGQLVRAADTPELSFLEEHAFSDGMALIKDDNDAFGYIDKQGRIIITPQYASAKPFSGGRAATKISDRWGFIDRDQSTIIAPQFISAGNFSDKLAPVRKDANTWGYANRQGQMVIAAEYEEARSFNEGRAAVMLNGRWGFINRQGRLITEAIFDEVLDFRNGAARVRLDEGDDQKYGYVDADGAWLWYPTN